MNDIIIRESIESDYTTITDISIIGWRHAYRGMLEQELLDSLSFEEILERKKKWFSGEGHCSIVAVIEGAVVGFCDFGVSRRPEYGPGEIKAIYLLPQYQGRGVGKLIMQSAMSKLREYNLIPFSVSTLEQNIAAQKFYEKLGFDQVGDITTRVGDRDYPERIYVGK